MPAPHLPAWRPPPVLPRWGRAGRWARRAFRSGDAAVLTDRPAKGAVWPVSELAPLRNLAHGSVRADPKRQRGKEDRTVETLGSESIHPTLPRAATQPPRLRSALANRAPAASPPLSARQPAQPPHLASACLASVVQELDEIGTASFCPRTG